MKTKQVLTLVAISAFAALPLAAGAHGGADAGAHHGFAAGLGHPFAGLDHLAAMLAVGVWSAGTPTRRWLAPLAFAAMLLVGALLARGGADLFAVEPMIAGSLLVVGALLAAPRRLPAAAATLVIGGFALFHGAAHGRELAGGAALAGMMLATALLHGLGIALGATLRRSARWPQATRIAGAAVAAFGLALLA